MRIDKRSMKDEMKKTTTETTSIREISCNIVNKMQHIDVTAI
jgi:hypothetical protein